MNSIFKYLSKNIVMAILVTVITGITVTTSATGTAKLISGMKSIQPSIPEVKEIQKQIPTPTTENNNSKSKTAILASITSSVSTNDNNVKKNNTCIITLFGKQYDVYSLKSSHSGGDIFTCNSDMSSTYQRKHGTNVSRMQQFLVTSTGSTSSNASSQTVSGLGSSKNSDYSNQEIQENDDDQEKRDSNENEVKHVETKNNQKTEE